jgi:hypothetical protein
MSALPDLIVNSAYSPELAELREQMDEVTVTLCVTVR